MVEACTKGSMDVIIITFQQQYVGEESIPMEYGVVEGDFSAK